MSVEALKRTRHRKMTLVLTSDAHHANELDRVEYAARNAERAWIEAEQVVNLWPSERLESWLAVKQPGSG
jgi:histidinol phosphatase-like PHP family hydrolase